MIRGEYWKVAVSDSGSTAERWRSGLRINGDDIASFNGNGWRFELEKMLLHVTGAGPFEITGEENGVCVSVESICSIVLSKATL